MLDTRDADTFSKGFIPNSINIGIDGNFAVWVGTLIPDINQQLLLITEPGREEEVITRLARVGYDHAIGYLRGGFAAWKRSGVVTDSIASISALEFSSLAAMVPDLLVIDVRRASEFESQHLENAINIPLDYINESMPLLDKQKTYYVHCAGGYRSMVFISILKARGYNNLINVEGGFAAIRKTHKLNLTDYVSPTTQL